MVGRESNAKNDNPYVSCCTTLAILLTGTVTLVGASPLAFGQAGAIDFNTARPIAGTLMQDAEPPQIAASGRNAYIIWHEFPTETALQPDIFLARSFDRGRTFQSRKNLSDSLDVASDHEQMALSGRFGQNVFAIWVETDPINLTSELFLAKSVNGGASFSSARKLIDVGNPTNPRISATGNQVFVAWQAEGQAGNSDIFFMSSKDKGNTFSNVKNLSENDGTSEFTPGADSLVQIGVPRNRVVVTWRDDTIPGAGFEIFFTQGK